MRSVRTVVTASAVSTLGDAAVMVALVLRVHATGTGPWAVSLLLLCFALPVVATMGLAGAVADRLDRRRVLVVTGLVQAAAVGGLVLVDGLAATCALVLVLQTGFALGQPSWQSVVPTLVPDGEAGRVIALQHGLRGVAGPAGAGLGGLLAQWGGPSSALAPALLAFLLLAAAARTLPAPARRTCRHRTDPMMARLPRAPRPPAPAAGSPPFSRATASPPCAPTRASASSSSSCSRSS